LDQILKKLEDLTRNVENLEPSLLISAGYDGEKEKAYLKFYSPKSNRIYLWYDNTNHKPYCFSLDDPEKLSFLKEREDIINIIQEKKLSLLQDKEILVSKIIAKDPLAIGGGQKSIRNLINAWEADIKYYENYLYDLDLTIGAFYYIKDSKLYPYEFDLPDEVKKGLEKLIANSSEDFKPYLLKWAKLLNQPLPNLKRASLDIEVLSKELDRIPDPEQANDPVIAVGFVGSDGVKKLYLLNSNEVYLPNVEVLYFKEEKELMEKLFLDILDYPIIITFNGDEFDLKYLYYRAKKLGFDKAEIPIYLGRDFSGLKHGVHLDLYKLFSNRSIQIYAFSNKYVEYTLNAVSEALLGVSKIELDSPISELPKQKLAEYCYNDADITYRLTSYDSDLLMKLLLVIARIAKMPLDDVSRLGVSNWIRSLLYFEHRRINALIPNQEELLAKGGASSSAIIKGKKYRGGLVVEPIPGIHFNVAVLDFASLYPSIIKVYNLSYETVRCIHEECKKNLIPETDHWICEKRKGITSLVIGSLRDLRVSYYKPLSKNPNLSKEDKELYQVVTQALKVILNASYGVMGAEIFPLYCLPVADATAAIGRYIIKRTIDKCKDLGIEVIYGDTDSIFLRSPSLEQIEAVASWAQKEFGVELDLDKNYRYVAMSQRKKNYLGVLVDGTLDVKGLTGKKSHIPPFIREAFYDTLDILSNIKTKEDFERAREEIRKKVKEWYKRLMNKEIEIEKLSFQVMLGKDLNKYKDITPQHIKAARLLKKELKAGDIVRYVKTVTPPGVKPVELVKREEVDIAKYVEYMRSTFEQLLDSLGYDFDEILGVSKLEDFWS